MKSFIRRLKKIEQMTPFRKKKTLIVTMSKNMFNEEDLNELRKKGRVYEETDTRIAFYA